MLLTKIVRTTIGAACLAVAAIAFITVAPGCATIDKTLDEVDKGLDKAEETIDRVEKTIDKVDKTVSRVAKAKDRVVDRSKNLATRMENIVKTKRVIVEKGETLWKIASTEYSGHELAPAGEGGYLWPLICEQNGYKNCHLIEIGDIARLLPADRLHTVPKADMKRHIKVAFEAP